MGKIDRKELFRLLGFTLLFCIVAGLTLVGSKAMSATLPSRLGGVISGIWVGIAFTFISLPTIKIDPAWDYRQRRSYRNRIVGRHIILGSIIFCIGGVFGSGVVFGIDLIGVCNFGSLSTSLAEMIQGNVLIITLIGAGFGAYMSLAALIDENIRAITALGNITILWIGIPFVFFSFSFSRALVTPFIFAACVARLLSSVVLYKRFYMLNSSPFQKGLIVIGIFLLPLVAYISRIMIICPK